MDWGIRSTFQRTKDAPATIAAVGNMRRIATVIVCLLALFAPASASDLRFDNGRIVLETTDKTVRLAAGARVQVDGVLFDGDNRFADAVRFRRLRGNIVGSVYDDWHFRIEYEFAKRNEGWRSLWASYTGLHNTKIILGNQRAPVSLENLTSSSEITLLERSTMNAFIQQDFLGGSVITHGDNWTASAGIFRESIASRHADPNRGTTFAGRLTWTPISDDDEVIHLGISALSLDFGSAGKYKVAAHPLVDITPDHLVNTHVLRDVSSASVITLEAAWSRGAFRLQGEYSGDIVHRSGRPDPIFHGGYAQASWVVTGEPYRYDHSDGTFDGVRPDSPYGAIELAARVGTLDLQDVGVTGGRQDDLTLGVNWYPNRFLRFGADVIWANAVPDSSGKNELLRAGLFRAQLSL